MAILGISGRAEMIHRDDLVSAERRLCRELGQWRVPTTGRRPHEIWQRPPAMPLGASQNADFRA